MYHMNYSLFILVPISLSTNKQRVEYMFIGFLFKSKALRRRT